MVHLKGLGRASEIACLSEHLWSYSQGEVRWRTEGTKWSLRTWIRTVSEWWRGMRGWMASASLLEVNLDNM